jgi:hypothetical protein
LDTSKIVAELTSEKERLDRAIDALEETDFRSSASKSRTFTKSLSASKIKDSIDPKSGDLLTEERRKRRSESMKKSWAKRRTSA